MYKKQQVLLVAAAVFGGALSASAQLQGPRLNSLFYPEVAPAEEAAEKSAPSKTADTYVIDSKKLERGGYASAFDALSSLPGIFVRRTSAYGRSDANIRGWGSDGQRIAVLVDGRPEKMSLYGCTVSQTLPLNNVERIEVLEGPASALYGSGAFGGAVNFITRGAQKPFEGDITASYGSYNTRLLKMRAGAKNGDNDFFAAAERRTSDGYTANSAYEGNDYTVEFGRRINDASSLRLRNKFYAGTEHDPAPVSNPAAGSTWFDYRRGALDLSADYRRSDLAYSARLFTTYGHHQFSDGWLSDDETYGLQTSAVYSNESGAKARLGADYSLLMAKRTVSATTPAWDKREWAAYLAASSPFANIAKADGALRWTGTSTTAPLWVPSLSVAVTPLAKTEVYGSVSKGIRFPAMSELYVFGVSNPDLKPEEMWGYESGVRYFPAEGITLRGAAYMSEGSNLIQFSNGKFNNVGDFLFRGFLTEAKADITDDISAGLSYTFQDSGSRTQGRPGHTGTGSLTYSPDKWGLTAEAYYAGKYYAADNSQTPINDIFTLNLRGWYDLAKDCQLYAAATNLLDRHYVVYGTNTSTSGLFLMPGFMISGGLKYSFGG